MPASGLTARWCLWCCGCRYRPQAACGVDGVLILVLVRRALLALADLRQSTDQILRRQARLLRILRQPFYLRVS